VVVAENATNIYVLFFVRKLQGNVSPLSVEPPTFKYSFRKNLYQNQMHAGRFSKEGCISKERHQMSSVFWLGHDPLPSTDNNPSA
jgi:hypothetical protein